MEGWGEEDFVPKLYTVIFCLLFMSISAISAEQLTTVGVVDISSVYTSFFSDSAAVRSLENLRNSIQRELDGHVAELRQLQQQKLDAENAGRESVALRLDNEIFEKSQYIQEFQRVKQGQLQDRQNNLRSSESFLSQLQAAISYVAEANGFTIVVSASDDKLLWWSQEVDITDLVLERLRETS